MECLQLTESCLIMRVHEEVKCCTVSVVFEYLFSVYRRDLRDQESDQKCCPDSLGKHGVSKFVSIVMASYS